LWPDWFQAPQQLAAWWLNYLNIALAEFFEHFSPSLAELFERRQQPVDSRAGDDGVGGPDLRRL